MKTASHDHNWRFIISAKKSLFYINYKELWRYRDLLLLFVKRDIVTVYKQTILGPLWYIIQPLLTALTFTLVFNKIANIETGEAPSFLFNLAGISIWSYFKNCLTATSNTFTVNANIFSKVYFPRLILPLASVISNLLRFFIELLIFSGFYIYYYANGASIFVQNSIWLLPILILLMALLGLGFGMIISSMVTKYRDIKFLLNFGIQLLMYISAVMYPISLVTDKLPDFSWLVVYNPLAYIIETTRYITMGIGVFSVQGLVYTSIFTLLVLCIGVIVFNKTEKTFIDTV